MSNFASLLSSLDREQQSPNATSKPRAPPPQDARPSPVAPMQAPSGLKRKHEDISSSTQKPPASLHAQRPQPPLASSTAYQGTANRPRPPITTRPSSSGQAQSVPRPASTTPTPTASEARLPPTKGSFREMMERAKAAQQAKPAEFGMIKHKPVAKPERKRQSESPAKSTQPKDPKAAAKAAGAQSTPQQGMAKIPLGARVMDVKPKKKPTDVGYSGTMRLNPVSLKPRPSSSASPATAQRPKPKAANDAVRLPERTAQKRPSDDGYEKKYRYAGSSAEDEEDYDEDDESDDMGGGGFDALMDEEEESLRLAKKADAEEIAREKALKTEKARKKAALEQLRAKRGEKP